jgi:hypothetical protein
MGVIPIPRDETTATYDISYRTKEGLFGKHSVSFLTSLAGARPRGTPLSSQYFVEFVESPAYDDIDLYVSPNDLTLDQYAALVASIRANRNRIEQTLGRPLASIRRAL